MAYVREKSQLGIPPQFVVAAAKVTQWQWNQLKNLFGGGLLANRSTVERWYDSMPAWAKQVITVDDLMATEQQSRGAGAVVNHAKAINDTSLIKGNWTQADLNHFINSVQEDLRKATSEPQNHDFWILQAALETAAVNIAQYNNPLGAQQPGEPPSLPPPTRPGLPPTPGVPTERPPTERRPEVQEAGFGGLPTWAMVLLAAGLGLPVIIGLAKKGRFA